jgi:hypothetical protein
MIRTYRDAHRSPRFRDCSFAAAVAGCAIVATAHVG